MKTSIDQTTCSELPGSQSSSPAQLGPLEPGDATFNTVTQAAKPQRWSTKRRVLHTSAAIATTLTLIGGALLGFFFIGEMEGEISVKAFEDVILSWGHWGVLASIGLMVIHSFVPFPAELVALANGMLYGPLWGTVITWGGAMLGAFLAFGLSRAFGRPLIEALLARRHWQRLDDWAGENAAEMIFLARFLPVISFNLVNYAAGLTRVSWWTFAWTTGLGILPMTILMAVMGDQAGRMPWHWWILLMTAAGIGWLVLRRRLHRETARRMIGKKTATSVHREGSDPAPVTETGLQGWER